MIFQITKTKALISPFLNGVNKSNPCFCCNSSDMLENSLYYYGARYYTAWENIWLSVDPLSDERPSLSPYNYCQLNLVNRIDPTGMLDDWYETPSREKKYNANINSSKEMIEMGIEGKYLGKTHKKGNKYYSLFGEVKNLKTMEGMLHEKIDQALINYANHLNEYDPNATEILFEQSTDFNIGVPYRQNKLGHGDNNNYSFNYEGATGYYFVYGDLSAMRGKLDWGRNSYSANKNHGHGKMKSGYNTHIYVAKNSDLSIVTLVFPTLNSKNILYKKWTNEFFPKKSKK
jgi:RHS repeat-associated protein